VQKSVATRRAAPDHLPERLVSPYTRAAFEALVRHYGSPLLLVDCDQVRTRYRSLAAALPGVDLHYALKPLPDPAVVAALKGIGGWFDLASSGEVDVVRAAGIAPQRCIHTHPIKRDADIRDALRFGVRTFVADNVDELGKFVRHRRRAEVLLRVAFRSADAVCDLSRKFGCEAQAVPELLRVAARLGVKVAGLSFHAGSQAATPAMHVQAIEECATLMREAGALAFGDRPILDIGGGFPADYRTPVMPIAEFCAPIVAALRRLPATIRVIAEPGRYIAAPAGTCVASIIGRAQRDGRWWYYLDDGIYGSFSGQLFDHARYQVECLRDGGERLPSVLAGPTCDSIDVIDEDLLLPALEVGDLIVGRNMGAYSSASSTDFNFVRRARVVPVNLHATDATVIPLPAR
jgi:ornithine decarboxylase